MTANSDVMGWVIFTGTICTGVAAIVLAAFSAAYGQPTLAAANLISAASMALVAYMTGNELLQ